MTLATTLSPSRDHRCGVEPVGATVGADPARHSGRGPAWSDRDRPPSRRRRPRRRLRSRHASKPRPPAKPTAAAPPAPIDGGWPRIYDLPSGGTILVYQPQVASWDKQTHLVAFSAVSLPCQGADKPAVGTIKLEADTKVSRRPSAWSASRT